MEILPRIVNVTCALDEHLDFSRTVNVRVTKLSDEEVQRLIGE